MDIEAKITSPSASQQAHLSDASPQLNVVDGNAGDSVTATGFTDSGTDQTLGNTTYDVYTSGSATLWIDQAVSVV